MGIAAQIVLFDGFDPLGALASYEVLLAGASASGGAVTVELVSPDQPGAVPAGTGGLVVRTSGTLDPDHTDLIVVPGLSGLFGMPNSHEAGAVTALPDPNLPALIRRALHNPDVAIAATDGGAVMLALAGLIRGRHVATLHPARNLDGTGAVAVPARVADDGDLITASGITAGLDLCLYLLDRELGPRIAHSVEQTLGYERRGTAWRREGALPVPR